MKVAAEEEANGGGRWCAHTPCAPNTHCGVRGGYGRNHLHAITVVFRNTVCVPTPKGHGHHSGFWEEQTLVPPLHGVLFATHCAGEALKVGGGGGGNGGRDEGGGEDDGGG